MKIHIVQKGDTFYKIAKKYGIDVEQLKSLNTHIPNMEMLLPGMKVKVPTVKVPVKKEEVVKEVKKEKVMEEIKLEFPELPKQPMPPTMHHPYLSMNLYQMQPYVYYQPHLMMPPKECQVPPVAPAPAPVAPFTPPELPSLPSMEEIWHTEKEMCVEEELPMAEEVPPMPQLPTLEAMKPVQQPVPAAPMMMPYHPPHPECFPPMVPAHHPFVGYPMPSPCGCGGATPMPSPCGCGGPNQMGYPPVMYPYPPMPQPYGYPVQSVQQPYPASPQPGPYREAEEEEEEV